MTTIDILLVLLIAGAFVVGFLWGVIRSLLMLVGWVAVFILAALLSVPVGDYLTGQWPYSPAWERMAAFAILYFAGLVLAVILLWIGIRGPQGLSRYKLLDDVVSGLLMAAVALLSITGVIVVLATAYRGTLEFTAMGPEWPGEVYQLLLDSTIGDAVERTLVPLIGALFDPLLPAFIRDVMR